MADAAGLELALEDERRERVLDEPLDGPLQGARAVHGVVAGVGDGLARALGEPKR
jgi:hypothetical protein